MEQSFGPCRQVSYAFEEVRHRRAIHIPRARPLLQREPQVTLPLCLGISQGGVHIPCLLPRHESQPLSGQQWREILNGNLARNHTSARTNLSHAILSKVFEEKNITITEMPPVLDTVDHAAAMNVLWELSELNFRFELLALDSRLADIDDAQQDHRQQMVLDCSPGANRCLLNVNPSIGCSGFAAIESKDRLPALLALKELMKSWRGPKPLEVQQEMVEKLSEADVLGLEAAITQFYVQSFFDSFGRAAVVPRRLPRVPEEAAFIH